MEQGIWSGAAVSVACGTGRMPMMSTVRVPVLSTVSWSVRLPEEGGWREETGPPFEHVLASLTLKM